MAFDSATNQMILFDAIGNTWNWAASLPSLLWQRPPASRFAVEKRHLLSLSANVPGATFSWTAAASWRLRRLRWNWTIDRSNFIDLPQLLLALSLTPLHLQAPLDARDRP